ncbi:MAG: zinc ribbon domain-containing protein [Clostridia bacterium]|nr:zinc ribbon domain-containing protein [Clostridia bacterium]
MEFLDDVLVKAKDVFESACRTTEKAVNVGKQKIDISSMKTALAKRYEALGRAVIEPLEEGEDLPDEVADIIEDIRVREEALQSAQEKLSDISGKDYCPACGKSNPAGARFCNGCGEKLA